jgi:predicted TIM-barrel fold metal-dependent hydrolase
MNTFEKIHEYVSTLSIIDTHEHLPDHGTKREKPTDVLREYLSHYFDKDLVSAGLPLQTLDKVRDASKPLMDRWKLVEPFWELASNTGYARALDLAAREVHGVDGIRTDTLEALDASFQKSLQDPGWFRHILKEKCRISVSLLDGGVDYGTAPWCDDLFTPIRRIDNLIMLAGFGAAISELEIRNGLRVRNFDDYLELIDADIARCAKLGYCGFKLPLAYARTLRFERSSGAQAAVEFDALVAGSNARIWCHRMVEAPPVLQDYCLHRCLRAIEKTGLPLQVHTGLQEGNGNVLSNSDPILLSNLFLQYPDLDFDLFHIGYPYWMTLAALAKNFPNVYIDMCWAHIISPEASMNAIMEYTDSVPSNKLSAFGGDFLVIDPIYGHQFMARRNASEALARKVDRGVFDVDTAKVLARRMFVDNPIRLFHLEKTVAGRAG